MTSRNEPGSAQIVGTGLIGGSLGLALRARGWTVTGSDSDGERAERAVKIGALDAVGEDPDVQIVFIATPVSATVAQARRALERFSDTAVVTDVAGVKAAVSSALDHPRFVGGHPMAGSEQIGLDGADPDLFVGATWVLTPNSSTDAAAYATVSQVVGSLGAEVVSLSPEQHDNLVAVVSHVPHLTAATLMNLADAGADKHAALLRLAAGGFRDMTRVAAGHPGIWPDLCAANSDRNCRDSRRAGGGALRHARPGRFGRPGLVARSPRTRSDRARPFPLLRSGPSASQNFGYRSRTALGCLQRSPPSPAHWASTSLTSRSLTALKGSGACSSW